MDDRRDSEATPTKNHTTVERQSERETLDQLDELLVSLGSSTETH